MAQQSIRVGDVVQLKSGGPAMTVQAEAGTGYLECIWFDAGGAHQLQTFKVDTLKRVPDWDGGTERK